MAVDLFDPGRRGQLFDRLTPSPAAFCTAMQGVLIHDYFGGLCYPAVPPGFATASRETRPVAARLAEIDGGGEGLAARPPERRAVGTCRDFALMFCAMARHHGMAARVRCGFADYLDPAGFEDHWVCEYRAANGARWMRADAQIDAEQAAYLKIDIDPTALREGDFLTGCEAWLAVRQGDAAAEDFGHGAARGAWFLKVNLMRDLLCLQGQIVSDWDRWREVAKGDALDQRLPDALCDRLAKAGQQASQVGAGGEAKAFDVPAPPFGGTGS